MKKTNPEKIKTSEIQPLSLIFRIGSGFIALICIFSTILVFNWIVEKFSWLWLLIGIVNLHGLWIFGTIMIKGNPPGLIRKYFYQKLNLFN